MDQDMPRFIKEDIYMESTDEPTINCHIADMNQQALDPDINADNKLPANKSLNDKMRADHN